MAGYVRLGIEYVGGMFSFQKQAPSVIEETSHATEGVRKVVQRTLAAAGGVAEQNMPPKAPASLTATLWQGIKEDHLIAKQNHFLNTLIDGEMAFCSKAYVVYLCNLFVIHEALEKGQRKLIEDYGDGVIVYPFLFRSERLLNDIKMWSMFNTLGPVFTSEEMTKPAFIARVKSYAEPDTKAFVSHLDSVSQENSLFIVGAMYVLYGSLMSSGQLLKEGRTHKEGVLSGFITRIEEKDEEGEEPLPYKVNICQEIERDPGKKMEFAEQSISVFCFPEIASIATFKREWHQKIDALKEGMVEQGQQTADFEARLIEEAKCALGTVLNFTKTMHEKLEKN
jgi:heme oxygenase